MQISELRKKLDDIARITNEQWIQSLDERKRRELEFHDLDRDSRRLESLGKDEYEKRYGNRRYYRGARKSRLYVVLRLKDLDFASRFFRVENLRFWHITSILAAVAGPLLPVFDACDTVLTRIPGVRLMAWQFTFELVKSG